MGKAVFVCVTGKMRSRKVKVGIFYHYINLMFTSVIGTCRRSDDSNMASPLLKKIPGKSVKSKEYEKGFIVFLVMFWDLCKCNGNLSIVILECPRNFA